MSILILNTFSAQASMPSFNLAYLSGLAKLHDIENTQVMDINLLLWDHLLSQEFIKSLVFNEDICSQSPNIYCKQISARKFRQLKNITINNIEDAKTILRGNQFSSFSKFIWAQKVIYDVCALVYYHSGTFFTTHIPHWHKIGFKYSNINDIINLSQDHRANPLIAIMEEKIIPQIIAINPSVISVDIMFPWDIIPALTLNTLIKKHLPDVHINYAGQGFDEFCFSRILDKTQHDRRFLFAFDSIFVYRNDIGLIELLKSNANDLSMDNLIHIKNDRVKCNKINNTAAFDCDVMPNYDWANFSQYIIPKPVVVERLSYKCYWSKCSFCSINSNKLIGSKINIDKTIAKLISYKEKWSINHFWFLDEGCPIEIALEFAQRLLKEKIKITWSLRTRVSKKLNSQALGVLKDAGLKELWIGLEHVSFDILEKMNKTTYPHEYKEVAKELFENATEVGIGLHFCHIMGFPSEQDEHRNELLDFYKELEGVISKKPFFCTFNVFGLMRGSKMYTDPMEFGITSIHENEEQFDMISIPYSTKWGDDTNSIEIMNNLNQWLSKYLKNIIKDKTMLYFWFAMSDTPYELLFKENYDYNPFGKCFSIKMKFAMFVRQVYTNKYTNALERKIFKIQ